MAKLKLLLTIGLCVALLCVPLTVIAENPLPVSPSCDGHPWDDGNEGDESSNPGDTTIGTETDMTVNEVDEDAYLDGKPLRAFLRVIKTGIWLLKVR